MKDVYLCQNCDEHFESKDIKKNGIFIEFLEPKVRKPIVLCDKCMKDFRWVAFPEDRKNE